MLAILDNLLYQIWICIPHKYYFHIVTLQTNPLYKLIVLNIPTAAASSVSASSPAPSFSRGYLFSFSSKHGILWINLVEAQFPGSQILITHLLKHQKQIRVVVSTVGQRMDQ